MSNREAEHMQGQKNAIHMVAAKSRRLEAQDSDSPLSVTTQSVPFQLIADFAVETPTVAEFIRDVGSATEEYRLFMTILTTPEALNRICRLALVCDLNVNMDENKYFDGAFMGPEPGDILNSILSYLSPDQQEYWTRLRKVDYNEFGESIDSVFGEFQSSLKKIKVLDVNTGEAIPLRVSSRVA
jgi:hypothetical protein